MVTKNIFQKLMQIFTIADVSLQNKNILTKIPDYAWPKYFGAYIEIVQAKRFCFLYCRLHVTSGFLRV